MLSKLVLVLTCGLPLAAQVPAPAPSPVQDALKAARSALKSGDIEDARTQYEAAFNLALVSDPALASGVAVELADMLRDNSRLLPAAAFLMEAANQMESRGAAPQVQVPIANRLTHIAESSLRNGNNPEAKQALERSVELLRAAYGPDALCVANVLSSLARADHALGDDATAVRESTEAQRIREANRVDLASVKSVDASMVPPHVQSKIDPQYSEPARAAHLSGTVLLSVVIVPDGTPKDIQVQMPLGLGLDQEAVNAVEQWKFSPAVLKAEGQPVPARATIEVNFRLL